MTRIDEGIHLQRFGMWSSVEEHLRVYHLEDALVNIRTRNNKAPLLRILICSRDCTLCVMDVNVASVAFLSSLS